MQWKRDKRKGPRTVFYVLFYCTQKPISNLRKLCHKTRSNVLRILPFLNHGSFYWHLLHCIIIIRTHIHLTHPILWSFREGSMSYSAFYRHESERTLIKHTSNKNDFLDGKPYSFSCDQISLILLLSWAILGCKTRKECQEADNGEKDLWMDNMKLKKVDFQVVGSQWWHKC